MTSAERAAPLLWLGLNGQGPAAAVRICTAQGVTLALALGCLNRQAIDPEVAPASIQALKAPVGRPTQWNQPSNMTGITNRYMIPKRTTCLDMYLSVYLSVRGVHMSACLRLCVSVCELCLSEADVCVCGTCASLSGV